MKEAKNGNARRGRQHRGKKHGMSARQRNETRTCTKGTRYAWCPVPRSKSDKYYKDK